MSCSASYQLLEKNEEKIKKLTGKKTKDDAIIEVLTFSVLADIIERGIDIEGVARLFKTWTN